MKDHMAIILIDDVLSWGSIRLITSYDERAREIHDLNSRINKMELDNEKRFNEISETQLKALNELNIKLSQLKRS
jgi:hypothetical protein